MKLLLLLLLTLAVGTSLGAAARPGPGDAAPAFTAPASTGAAVSLADYLGKKQVVLAFFPKAFTGG
jgi:peroxiredoxin Q/BCP